MYNFAPKKQRIMSKSELRNLIILLRENSMITMSWGIHDVMERPNGITFFVKGKKYKGLVIIAGNKGKYDVTVGNETYKSNRRNLIKTIDDIVEFDGNFYNLSKK